MAFTQADLDGLKRAIADAGTSQSVRYNDGSGVQYHPVADMIALLRVMELDVQRAGAAAASAVGAPVPRRFFRGSFNSGW